MKHLLKQQSLEQVVRYNRGLLIIATLLAVVLLLVVSLLIQKEEKWILIPALDIERKLELTSKNFSESYLREWARSVIKEVFTSSPEEIDNQIANIRNYSSKNKDLDQFFSQQVSFIKGSNVSCVFYFKDAELVPGATSMKVNGTFHYWFANSKEKVSKERSYLLSYKRTPQGLILLTNIEEIRDHKTEEAKS
ncbi:MAG: conjugal transfer protein [Rickettsiaceae bacterium]|nr:MAG: conjugal transfer protein [Rickettsiaceae bacterium]